MANAVGKSILCMFIAVLPGLAPALARAEGCVRNTPAPLFAAASQDIGAHAFTLLSEHEAIETFRLAPDTKVEVRHGGCEYIVTTFRFTSPALFARAYSTAQAYRSAAAALRQLHNLHAASNFDLPLAAQARQREAGRRHPRLEREITVRGDGAAPLEAGVRIVSAGRRYAGRRDAGGHVEVILFRGPL